MFEQFLKRYEQLEKYLNAYESRGYINGSILIAHKGEIIINRGIGVANYEHQIANTPKTKYRVGSITKGFTAAAILHLQEKRLLHVDDFIYKYLPEVLHGDKINIHHLLTHSSGLSDYTDIPEYWEKTMRLPFSYEKLLDTWKDKSLEFTPGERFRYTNASYFLLGIIIERVSGQSYSEYLRENIYQPLQMFDSGYDNGIDIINNLASGYSVWGGLNHIDYVDMSNAFSAYGIYSTTEDLYLWDQALYHDQLLNSDSIKQLFTPYLNQYGYGFGVSYVEYNQVPRKLIEHFGDINGYHTGFYRFVEEQLTIIASCNWAITPIEKIMDDLANILFGTDISIPEPIIEPVSINNELKQQIAGIYYSVEPNDQSIEISFSHDKIYIIMPRRYGALYKFEIIPVFKEGNHIIFSTTFVNEQITINLIESSKHFQLMHKDIYNKECFYIK